MLLFLFIFLLHYNVFICNGTNAVKFNESLLLHKLYQNLNQVNTVLKEVEQKKHNISVLKEENDKYGKKQDEEIDHDTIRDLQMIKIKKKDWNSNHQKNLSANLQLSPQYDQRTIKPTISDRRQGFTRRFPPPLSSNIRQPLLVIPRPPSGYRVALVPIRPEPKLRNPDYLLRPIHSEFLSDYRLQNAYLQPPDPYLPDTLHTLRPAPKNLNQSSLDAELKIFHQQLPQIFNPSHFPLLPPFFNPAESWISQAVTTPSSTMNPTNDKGEKIWLPNVYNHYVPNRSSREVTVMNTRPYSSITSTASTTRMSKINDYQTVTPPGPPVNIGQFFGEDEQGFLYVTVPQKDGTTFSGPLYSEALESTTAGDVFFGKIKVTPHPPPQPPTQRYLELVERLDEGYMVVFMLEFCRLVAVKNKKDVRQALYHTETVYNHWWNNGRLAWIDEPLQTVIWKLAILISEGDIDIVQTYTSMMFHMLLRRRQTLSSEVNSILETADLFYNDAEGEELFKALMEFENYPNTTKSSYGLCEGLIESFLRPFRRGRQYRTLRRKKLLDSINNALKTRFPRVLTESNEVTPYKVFQKKKKRRRRPYPHKMMRKRKKNRVFNINIFGRQNPNIDYENSILRDISTTAKDQATFRAMPSKNFRLKTTPRTARSYSFNKRNRKLTHQKITPVQDQEKLDNFVRNDHRSSKNSGRHIFVRKTSAARNRTPLSITTPSIVSVLLRSTYFNSNNERSSKDNGLHHFVRKTSPAGYRLSPRASTSSTTSVLLRSDSPVHLKRPRKNKMHYHQLSNTLEKSESQNKRDKLRAGLLRKISVFPTMF